jgi:hypothetical protein
MTHTPDRYRLFASSTVLYILRCANGWKGRDWKCAGLGAVGLLAGAGPLRAVDMKRGHCRDVALGRALRTARAVAAVRDITTSGGVGVFVICN